MYMTDASSVPMRVMALDVVQRLLREGVLTRENYLAEAARIAAFLMGQGELLPLPEGYEAPDDLSGLEMLGDDEEWTTVYQTNGEGEPQVYMGIPIGSEPCDCDEDDLGDDPYH